MRKKLNIIKICVLLIGFILLASFSHRRHEAKKIENIKVDFSQRNQLFIDEIAVNKLLIQNKIHVKNLSVENLDLTELEKQVETHAMVENAEVYLDINKILHVDIVQRKPIARVIGKEQYYIDSEGQKMPLSELYSARVPIITNLKNEQIESAYNLIVAINKDQFLKDEVTQVSSYPNESFGVRIRNEKFKIFLGKAEELDQKFMNFRAFYIKAKKDSLLSQYKRINLQYGNQVVCEKIES